jgi:glycosyltransferase involved in cell wall biosynthesis
MARTILLVVDHLQENGGVRVCHEAAKRLPRLGQPVELFAFQKGAEPRLTPDPEVQLTIASRRAVRLRMALPRIVLRLVQHSWRSAAVLAGSEEGYALLFGFAAARLTGRPFAVLVQNSLEREICAWVPPRLRRLTRWVHSQADLSVCVSAGLVPEVVATGLSPDRAVVVPVGIDVDRTIADGAAASPSVEPPYIVAAGRLDRQKGFDVLLDAFARAHDRLAGHRLVIIGEGPARGELEAQVTRLGLADRVVLTGFLSNLQPTLRGAALFVLPSRYEGMGGLVLLEAMVHGLPIIATDCVTGPRDLLEDGCGGLLVPVEDVEALADAMAAHIADPMDLRARARRGPDRARAFSSERWIDALQTALAPLVGGRP